MPSGIRRKQKAGVVVYRLPHESEPEVLIVTSRKFAGSWVFPVGTVEKNELLAVAARRECAEEAGYVVDVGTSLPVVDVPTGKKVTRFTFFLATVVSETSDWETDRRRKWLPLQQLVVALPEVFQPVALAAVAQLKQIE